MLLDEEMVSPQLSQEGRLRTELWRKYRQCGSRIPLDRLIWGMVSSCAIGDGAERRTRWGEGVGASHHGTFEMVELLERCISTLMSA